jgi:enoyl-CoA hydratase
MNHVCIERQEPYTTIRMSRGKVNALNPDIVGELRSAFAELKQADRGSPVVLAGSGPFFSFGFDVPEFLSYPRHVFAEYIESFTRLYREIYAFPRPVIAAINGHAVAGGCMLAIACDRRVMVSGRARIGLNEVTFGASVFAGSVEILRSLVGRRRAEEVLLTGALYSAEEAQAIGLVDAVCAPDELPAATGRAVEYYGSADARAYVAIKHLLRGAAAQGMQVGEAAANAAFLDLWYSPDTRRQLERITIR